MDFRMVNSSNSFGSERNGNTKASYMQAAGLQKTSSPLTASSATASKNVLLGADHSPKLKTIAGELKSSEPQFAELTANDCVDVLPDTFNNSETSRTKTTLFCSIPLEKVQKILANYGSFTSHCNRMKVTRKILCLYCDRTFANVNLRQKHVERCHSAKHLRRASLRKHQNILTSTPCIFCDQFTSTEHTLKDLFKHLIENHSNKYFGCLPCEARFLNSSHLTDHNLLCPNIPRGTQESASDYQDPLATFKSLSISLKESEALDNISVKTLRKKQKTRKEDPNGSIQGSNNEDQRKTCDVKNLRSKKLSVKSSRMILKRSKRLQAKLTEPVKKKRGRDLTEKKKNDRLETFTSKLNEKSIKPVSTFVNPYPEFDHFFQVKKITDHSIDNLKISSLTFDDVFDKAFFNRIRCNIQENLMHHIDGKLFKNEESENRISNFEKNANIPQETQNLNSENYGCEISLNAIAPTTMLLSNQFGDDPESQIEYGSKPSKKKTQLKKDEVHYKYFTRRKYQASILEHKENRDLSKLDMWTQYVIKRRQQKIQDDKRTPKEILDYFAGEEYKSMLRREELNRILDRRGPFEDLKEEVSKKAALDKLNGESLHTNEDNITEIGELLNDILNRVFDLATESSVPLPTKNPKDSVSEIPSYLNLRPSTDVIPENEIDKSDKIALICSSQETENFELPGNTVRGKNEKIELTGEWARSRIYICAACGLKLQNIKQFLEHKSATHQYIWVQHYEFVGNQSELYRHLSIPVLGKVGVLENSVQCKLWRRSDARLCTKCGKQCNSLGELHRHVLECGGDWTWMLARKKCKYRPFGAKSRRKRKGLVKRIYAQKSDVSSSEKKTYKKTYDIPRQKPSDADTIKRMLANLPPKRATRKIISLKDGFNQPRTRQVQTTKQTKFKCGKLLRQKTNEQVTTNKNEFKNGKKTNNGTYRRSLRCLSKVLSSRILDTKSSIIVRRKLKNEQTKKRNQEKQNEKENISAVAPKKITRAKKNKVQLDEDKEKKVEQKIKRSSPRIEKQLDSNTGGKITGIKRFFPVKKKKKSTIVETPKIDVAEITIVPESELEKNDTVEGDKVENVDTHSSVKLRKRKIDKIANPIPAKKRKVRKTGKTIKAKLRTSPRTIISENVQTNSETHNDNNTETINFFGEIASQEITEVADLKSTDVVDSEANEDVIIKLTDVVDCESNKDVIPVEEKEEIPLHINIPDVEKNVDTNGKIESVISPVKRKLKKPARGLNDCIAMLTSKLGKSYEESATDNIFNSDATNQVVPEIITSDTNRKAEYLLKVPFSNEHFHLRINHDETDVSDHVDNKLVENDKIIPDDSQEMDTPSQDYHPIEEKPLETAILEETVAIPEEAVEDLCLANETENDNYDYSPQEDKHDLAAVQNEEVLAQLEKITNDINWDNSLDENQNSNSDLEDEIPLATFIKSDEIVSSDSRIEEEITSSSFLKSTIDSRIPLNLETDIDQAKLTNLSYEDITAFETNLEEKVTDVKLMKKKDVTVLTEINANFCEHPENIPISFENNSNKLEPLNRRILDDSVLTNSDMLLQKVDSDEKLNDAKDINDLVSLEKYCEQQILSKLDKFNFFTKTSFESDPTTPVIIHEHLSVTDSNVDEVKKLESDTSEYKENVIRKHKQRKRGTKKGVMENHRKITLPEAISENKKGSKNDKPKPDEFLMDFTEDEVMVLKTPLVNDLILVKEETLHSFSEEKELKCVEIDEGSTLDGSCEEIIQNQSLSQLIELSDQTVKLIEDTTENVKELRRSSRNAKRITSYNETDLIDPLLDDLDSDRTISRILRETTKDIFGLKRKSRQKKITKNGHNEKKLNGEELFDLVKQTQNENILSKPANTYFNTFDEISNEFNDDNFDVFEDILEKSIAVIDETLSQPVELIPNETAIDTPILNDEPNPKPRFENKKKILKKKGKNQKHKNRNKQNKSTLETNSKELNDESKTGDIDYVLNSVSVDDSDVNTKDTSDTKSEKTKIYCEICDKSFSRVESLTKHKRTLTHISKLSELEAKEAALKTQCDPKSTNEESDTTQTMSHCGKDLNLLDMLATVDDEECKRCPSPFDVNVRNSNLKLADIINDVLNKPMSKKDDDSSSFGEVMTQQKDQAQVEVRRCKSLAERKSFESESFKNVDYFNPEISNAAAGTILEKQITLLENIIENRSTVNYIDEISVCSSPSLDKNSSECQIDSKQIDSVSADVKEDKAQSEESFLKPSQYEEISEDSNLRNYDEQKSRKALNRDEELFLECCSLLKSGSEVSSYSKKSNNISKDVSKPCDESDWLETNYLSQQGNSNFAECYSDSSRIRTPLGDSFSQDSNSATLSSQWNMNNSCTPTKKQIWKEDLKLKNKNLTFEEVFGTKDENMYCKDDNNLEDLHSMVSSFDRVISEVLNTELHPSGENAINRCVNKIQELPRESYENNDHKESTSADGRKVLTKGAMKIFEGLKVSIPTEDLNIEKILISGSSLKAMSFNDSNANSLTGEEVIMKTVKSTSNCRQQNKFPVKKSTKSISRTSSFKKQNNQTNAKVHDVYDFEETQDNSDVFTKPDFRTFRNNSEKSRKPEQDGSDDDSQDCTDPFGLDAMSSSTSSISEVIPVKSRNQQNLTKKKCMIMGRIFKNVVVKSKVEDEDIRNIPVIDNTKLVEDFVLNCPEPEAATVVAIKKPRMTEEEMNLEFDKLVSKQNDCKQSVKTCSAQSHNKNGATKRKQKIRNKKKNHYNSDSSDDEFKLEKHSIKRTKKKSTHPEKDSCINLEQELRECIGVASRKSQRKCTSGKQNVLIEYWSSDESSFEALLEKQIVNSVPQNHPIQEERSDHFVQTTHTEVKTCPNELVINDNVSKTHQIYNVEVVSKKPSSRSNRRKRAAANPLYHWSSSSEDESRDLIEVRPLRDEVEDDDRPIQHGWIVGDSPKKLVTMLAQAKGKKIDIDSVKEHGRKRPSVCS